MAPNTTQISQNTLRIPLGANRVEFTAHRVTIHTYRFINRLKWGFGGECAARCTVGPTDRARHVGGTMSDCGPRPGRIPATARAHDPACGPHGPNGPSARLCGKSKERISDNKAGGWKAGGSASGGVSESAGAPDVAWQPSAAVAATDRSTC